MERSILGQKMHGELILDPYMAPKFYTASSRGSYSAGEVWSILVIPNESNFPVSGKRRAHKFQVLLTFSVCANSILVLQAQFFIHELKCARIANARSGTLQKPICYMKGYLYAMIIAPNQAPALFVSVHCKSPIKKELFQSHNIH